MPLGMTIMDIDGDGLIDTDGMEDGIALGILLIGQDGMTRGSLVGTSHILGKRLPIIPTMEAFQERLTTDGLVILAITEPTLAGTEEAPARTEEIQMLITGRE